MLTNVHPTDHVLPRCDEWTVRVMVATGCLLVMAASQLVHVCYELHSLTMEHTTWVSIKEVQYRKPHIADSTLVKHILIVGVSHCHAKLDPQCLPRVALHCHDVASCLPLDLCRKESAFGLAENGMARFRLG